MKHKKQRRRDLRRKRKKRAEAAGIHTETTAPENEDNTADVAHPQESGGAARNGSDRSDRGTR